MRRRIICFKIALVVIFSFVLMGAEQCKTYSVMDEEIASLQSKIDDLTKQNKILEKKLSDLIGEKNSIEANLVNFKKETDGKNQKDQMTIVGLNEKVSNLESRLEDKKKELNDLRDIYKNERNENKRLNSLLTEREKTISSLEEKLKFTSQELDNQTSSGSEASRQLKDVSRRLEMTLTQLNTAEKEMQNLQASLASSQKENDSLKKELESYSKKLESIEKENSGLTEKISTLSPEAAQVPSLKKDLDESSKSLANLTKKISELEQKRNIYEQKILVLENELNNANDDVKSLRGENLTLKKDFDAANDALLKLQTELNGFEEDNQKMANAIKEKDAELNRLHKESQEQIESLNSENLEIKKRFEHEVKETQVRLKEVEGKMVISFIDKILFDSGKADVKGSAKNALHEVANIIKNFPNRQVVIEGHTDSDPILTWEFSSNWELSVARATKVLRYLIDKEGVPPQQLSVAGYSEYRPVDTNQTSEGRSSNRRVEIVIQPENLKRRQIDSIH